jgi:hypothetical protein
LKRGLAAIVAVGLRPCSGAILVLVFALAQGLCHVAGNVISIIADYGASHGQADGDDRMTEPLNQRVATPEGWRAFDRELAGLLRSRLYADAERLLSQALAVRPGAIADRCRATSVDAATISGWAELYHQIELRSQVTAVGLNLSNYNEAEAGAAWHDKEPAIEVSYYSDLAFRFSAASLEDILAQSAEPPTPWQGRMEPVEGPPPLAVRGLRALNSILLFHDDGPPWRPRPTGDGSWPPAPDKAVSYAVGAWFLHLRFHQAVARELARHGLPRALPVIVGEHDVPPFIRAVLMSPVGQQRPQPLPPSRRPDPVLAQQREAQRAAEAFVADMRAKRAAIKQCGLFAAAKRRALIAAAEAREKPFLATIGLAWPKPSWEASDAQFEAFCRAVRICCDLPEASA